MSEWLVTRAYDALNRLTAAEYEDGRSFHYTYDAVGNRLSETALLVVGVDPITNTYVYDDARAASPERSGGGNRLVEVNGVEYTWDDNGNLLSDGETTYTYDDANRLVEIEEGSTTASYTYNGLGDRVSQTANGETTIYHLDLAAGLTQVLDDGQHTYLYGNGRIGYSSDDMY